MASPKAATDVFTAVLGGWGRRGATYVALDAAEEAVVYDAPLMAWQNTAPKRLLEARSSLGSGR